METINEFCCANCLWYNGDEADKNAFCDEREDYVNRKFYCYKYNNIEDFNEDKLYKKEV